MPVRGRARRLTPAALCGYVQQAGPGLLMAVSGHTAMVVTEIWPVTGVLSSLLSHTLATSESEPRTQVSARKGAGLRREPDRAVPVRARARRLTPAALCRYVQQAGPGLLMAVSGHTAMVITGIWPVTGVPGSVACTRTALGCANQMVGRRAVFNDELARTGKSAGPYWRQSCGAPQSVSFRRTLSTLGSSISSVIFSESWASAMASSRRPSLSRAKARL